MSHLASVLTVRWPEGHGKPLWARALKEGELGVFESKLFDESLPRAGGGDDQGLRGGNGQGQGDAPVDNFPCVGSADRDLT